jgi:hypothetical protein
MLQQEHAIQRHLHRVVVQVVLASQMVGFRMHPLLVALVYQLPSMALAPASAVFLLAKEDAPWEMMLNVVVQIRFVMLVDIAMIDRHLPLLLLFHAF